MSRLRRAGLSTSSILGLENGLHNDARMAKQPRQVYLIMVVRDPRVLCRPRRPAHRCQTSVRSSPWPGARVIRASWMAPARTEGTDSVPAISQPPVDPADEGLCIPAKTTAISQPTSPGHRRGRGCDPSRRPEQQCPACLGAGCAGDRNPGNLPIPIWVAVVLGRIGRPNRGPAARARHDLVTVHDARLGRGHSRCATT
jgi:hypothetical protein